MALKDYLEKAGNVGMGALETINAPFEVVGESIRGAGESEPLKMATAADPTGFRYPSIVQRLAPSTRTPQPPADPFVKAYQGLEGLTNLPRGLQAASDMVTGQPDLAAQLGGMGLALGVMPPVARKVASAEMPKTLMNERGAVRIGKGEPYLPPGSPEREANFAKWFGKSKAVDESGKPVEVYHGTTHQFDTFSPDKANIENHYGKGHYFTDSLDDVNANYAGEGPDLTSRIERRTEQLYDELYPGESFQYNSPEYKAAQDRARVMAKKELSGGTPSVMPVNLKMKNPVILDGPNETSFRINYNERTGKESGSGLKLYNALIDEAQTYGEDGQKLWGEVMDKLGGDPEFTAKQFEDAFRSSDSIASITDEAGDLASNDLLRKVYQKAGFDGVIMDADKAFGGQRKSGKPMEMDWDTKHYIAFEPTQIKSTIGNRGTFNPRDPNITHAVPAAVGLGAAGAAAKAEAGEQQYADGGIVEEESDMPFQSEAQRGFMYANHPKIAKRFEEETPQDADLPEYKPMNQGGVAGDWRDEMTDHLDQRYGQPPPQNMYDGGVAGRYGVEMGDTATARGLPYAPPPEAPSMDLQFNPKDLFGPQPPAYTPPSPVQGPVFNPESGLPPKSVVSAAPTATPAAPMGPAGPSPWQAYLSEQKQSLDKYSPEAQAEMEQRLDQQRRGLIPNLALGGAGLADAIMQGVARAGSSNFQSNLQGRMDKTAEGQRQAFESGRAGNLARVKQNMEFAKTDPASPLSQSVQRANMVTLKLMGFRPEDAALISADQMPDVLSKRLTLEQIREDAGLKREVQAQNALIRGEELDLRRAEADRAAKKEATETRYKSAKDVLDLDKPWKVPIKLLGSEITVPGTSPVSRKDRREARNVIRGGMAPEQTAAPVLPQADKAEIWARENPNDPKSAAILRRLGK